MTTDSQSLLRGKAQVLQPGTYRDARVAVFPPRPKRSKLVERASALIALQVEPKLRGAFMLWAMSMREQNEVAKDNLTQQFDSAFYALDGHQMLQLAFVIEMVRGDA
jgi:hypothetical protein